MDDKLELVLSGQQYKKLQEVYYGSLMDEYKLNIVDIRVLLFLYEHESYDTAKDIVEMHHLTKSYVSKSVDRLIEKGFLDRKHLNDDRRYIHLVVKEAAVPLINAVRSQREMMVKNLFEGISAEQLEILRQIVRTMCNNVEGMLR